MQTKKAEPGGGRRFVVPMVAVALGVVAWVAQAFGGDLRGGFVSFAIMAAYGLLLVVLSGRSDVFSVLAGAAPDERFKAIDVRAVAAVGFVLILCVIGGFLWEQAHGRSGMPYTLLGALAGATYLGALLYGRFRS